MNKLWRILYSRTIIVLLSVFFTIWFVFWGISSLADQVPAVWTGLEIFSLLVAISIINRPINSAFKLSWIVFVLGVPVFGAVFYLIMRANLEVVRYRRTFQRQARLLREFVHRFGHPSEKAKTVLAQKDSHQLSLATYMTDYVGYPLSVNTDATYFSSGQDKFQALVEELKKAQSYIFMEYYIVDFGEMWETILEILKEKAAQGVEVRFLYDGMNSFSNLPYHYYKTLQSYGIKAKVFSQIIPALSTVQNNRDHRKITVIDGKVAFTGGVNIADEYINRVERFGYWKDAAIMVKGEAVTNFTLMFLQMWNYNNRHFSNDEQYLKAEIEQHKPEIQQDAVFLAYGENPFDGEDVAKRVYLDMFQSARHYIDIMTPYLVLDDETMDSLAYAAKRGVRVRILLPGIYDKQSAYLAARTDFDVYFEAGIELYEYTPGFVHSKVVIVDGERATVGTVNMDFRSFYLNFECGLYLYRHEQVLDAIAADFDQSFLQSHRVTLEGFKKDYPWYKRLAGNCLKVFSPLL